MSECKVCKEQFYYCSSCSLDPDSPRTYEYCSWNCMLEAKEAEIAALKQTIIEVADQGGTMLKQSVEEKAALKQEVERLKKAFNAALTQRNESVSPVTELERELAEARGDVDAARQEGYAQGWKHHKQIQKHIDSAVSQINAENIEAICAIESIVKNENDPEWSKVQKVQGVLMGCKILTGEG